MRIRFNPQPDISAYELALLYSNLTSAGSPPGKVVLNVSDATWAEIGGTQGVDLQRHFEILPDIAAAA
jgi:hypothetical protein